MKSESLDSEALSSDFLSPPLDLLIDSFSVSQQGRSYDPVTTASLAF